MIQVDVEALLPRLEVGESLSEGEIRALAEGPDILSMGMLADLVRRRIHGDRVTFVRVAAQDADGQDRLVPTGARELRLSSVSDSLDAAVEAVQRARVVAGERCLTGPSPLDVVRIARGSGTTLRRALQELHAAGLDALGGVALDEAAMLEDLLEDVLAAGYEQVRFTVSRADSGDRTDLFLKAAALQDRFGCVRAIDPLPEYVDSMRPSTGYADVKAIALARLAAQNIPTVQVSWLRYGPKLAQVALTFGADDLDAVTGLDDAPDGRRRAPLEEVRRNIEAAGFVAAERTGRFVVVG